MGWGWLTIAGRWFQSIHLRLGFVINVIEDFDERLEALTRAWSLAERLLVVSVMLANQNDAGGERFRDGVRTRRGTFQKYYTQIEIKRFPRRFSMRRPSRLHRVCTMCSGTRMPSSGQFLRRLAAAVIAGRAPC